jgi:superkiller protein 3
MTSRLAIAVLVAAVALAWGPAFGQAGLAEVQGKVVDADGNPVPDAVVTFKNTTNSALEFTAKTNRKGTYFLPNLVYNEPGEWAVTVAAEGYAPSRIDVESRKSDRTLVQEFETAMTASPQLLTIKAFGKATIDFTMLTAEQKANQDKNRATEAAAKATAEGAPQAEVDPLQVASRMVSEGDLAGSIEHFEAAIQAVPDDPERRELLAKVLYNLRRFDQALVAANGVREISPDREHLHLLFADIYAGQGNLAAASAELDQQAALTPQDPTLLRRKAWIAEQKGDPKAAIEANEALVAAQPDNVEAWLALGSMYAAQGQPDKSEQAFTHVVELDPKNAYKTFFNIGVLIENKPSRTEAEERRALEAFQKATEINPDYGKAHRHLAYALLRSGDLPGAKRELQRYLELEPNAADAAEVKALVSGLPSS